MRQYFERYQDGIRWCVGEADYGHTDDIEMSAFGIDCVILYGAAADGTLILSRYAAFPSLRTIPNDTFGTFALDFEPERVPKLLFNGSPVKEKAETFFYDGVLCCDSCAEGLAHISRRFFPASNARCLCEQILVRNISQSPMTVAAVGEQVHSYTKGTIGVYVVEIRIEQKNTTLLPEQQMEISIFYSARVANEAPVRLNTAREMQLRYDRVHQLFQEVTLDTGDDVLDTMFRFAKLRAGESIFRTKGGLLHSPGGKTFYAATWCNDQAEYAAPWFAFTGDKIAVQASLNAFEEYIPFMADNYERIPSSVIAEGTDIWEGAGDRGDAAMWLCGATLFALNRNDREVYERLWKGVQWCAEYCSRQTLPEGVVHSDSDELEDRFPTDHRANLSTSTLAYGGFCMAAIFAEIQHEQILADRYRLQASKLAEGIESYFGATLHGFRTYRYSKGFNELRSWICLPLCMDLTQRVQGTLDALFSSWLWTDSGVLTSEKGESNQTDTVWDRSTLFAFRSAFRNGIFMPAWENFKHYCFKRLLCERVPFAVEAYPEGNRRHLSAESALFCRIVVEGLLAVRTETPISFSFVPQLPPGLDHIRIGELYLLGRKVTIQITKERYEVCCNDKKFTGNTDGKRTTVRVD